MTTLPGQVVLDDTDPSISYSGSGWQTTAGDATKGFGNVGFAYNGTLHQVCNASASFSFQFDGTAVTVFGSLDNSNGTPSPPWLCTIDGGSIESTMNPGPSQISQPLCTASGLTGGLHNLSITVSPSVSTFTFDYVFYTPSSTASLANAMVITNDDPELFTWFLTGDFPDQPWVSFNGKPVTFFSVFPGELNGNLSFGSWVIDGSPPTRFIFNGQAASSPTRFYQVIFKTTPDVQHGPHNLTVASMGTSAQAPLYLETSLVTDAPPTASPTGSSTVTSQSSNPASPSAIVSHGPSPSSADPASPSLRSPSRDNGRSDTGAIVGGAVGGVALLICTVFFVFWMRRRSVFRIVTQTAADSVDEVDSSPRPYMASATMFTPTGGFNTPPPRSKEQPTAHHGSLGVGTSIVTPGHLPSERTLPSMSPSTALESQTALLTSIEGVGQSTEPFAVVHADSGLRLQNPQLVDLPPTYTLH